MVVVKGQEVDVSCLIFTLETMPGSCKYKVTPPTRTKTITELYSTFWGVHASYFALNLSTNLPLHVSLHEVQVRHDFVLFAYPHQ